MQNLYYLTPGPSELYFTVPDHLRAALRDKVGAISHRSQAFKAYYAHAVEQVRTLLNVPASHHIVFANSANEIWERLLQNCVRTTSLHYVNGAFSKKFYTFAQQLGKSPVLVEIPFGEGFDATHFENSPADNCELLALTQNETSSGVSLPLAHLATLRRRFPNALLTVDAVSSVPYPAFDFALIDSLYFSVQKGMGLPAGLGVWIFNDRCAAKAEQLLAEGLSIGTYHSIPSLLKEAANHQTPATPNVLGIYLLGRVAEDMNRRGITTIRQETDSKAAFLYQALEDSKHFTPLATEKAHRSQTVVVAKCLTEPSDVHIARWKKEGLVVASGYGNYKAEHIRIANFPTHSKEMVLKLVDML